MQAPVLYILSSVPILIFTLRWVPSFVHSILTCLIACLLRYLSCCLDYPPGKNWKTIKDPNINGLPPNTGLGTRSFYKAHHSPDQQTESVPVRRVPQISAWGSHMCVCLTECQASAANVHTLYMLLNPAAFRQAEPNYLEITSAAAKL